MRALKRLPRPERLIEDILPLPPLIFAKPQDHAIAFIAAMASVTHVSVVFGVLIFSLRWSSHSWAGYTRRPCAYNSTSIFAFQTYIYIYIYLDARCRREAADKDNYGLAVPPSPAVRRTVRTVRRFNRRFCPQDRVFAQVGSACGSSKIVHRM